MSREPAGAGPRLLVTIYQRDWLRPALLELLQQTFDVTIREVAPPRRRRWRGGRLFSKREMALIQLSFFVRQLLRPDLFRSDWRLVGFSGHFAILLWARVVAIFGRHPQIFLLNFYLHSLGENRLVRRLLRLLLVGDVRVVAQTRGDAEFFAEFLSVDRIKQLPYCKGESRWVSRSEVEFGSYVFSGGWTNRDYDALLRVAARLPEISFVVVASEHNEISESVPSNVSLHLDLEPVEFDRLLARSRAAVIPLRHDVGSSGQMVLLGAMQFSKAAVAPDVDALAGYVRDGETGRLYPLGDEDAMRDAIAGVYCDPDDAERLGAAARAHYEQSFTPASFDGPLAQYIRESAPPVSGPGS